MAKRQGKATIFFESRPAVTAYGAYVGKKEKDGPLSKYFENYDKDTSFQTETWEKAEAELQRRIFKLTVDENGKQPDMVFGGDLLNQCVTTAYAARGHQVPFLGVYGACSTMSETLGLSALAVEAGASECCVAITSSHFCTAERQFRFPLEYGSHRPQSAQWTATGAGCCVVEPRSDDPAAYIEAACFGRVIDLGVVDMNNMGAAMAPAAADTLLRFLSDTGRPVDSLDAVITGDLGHIGSDILDQLCREAGVDLSKNHFDCGKMLYDQSSQYVGAGGSGCGCSASVLNAFFLPKLHSGEIKTALFMATGALMSPTTVQQGESIPSIAHAILLQSPKM